MKHFFFDEMGVTIVTLGKLLGEGFILLLKIVRNLFSHLSSRWILQLFVRTIWPQWVAINLWIIWWTNSVLKSWQWVEPSNDLLRTQGRFRDLDWLVIWSITFNWTYLLIRWIYETLFLWWNGCNHCYFGEIVGRRVYPPPQAST